MRNDIKIDYKPTQKQIDQVKKWLSKERELTGEGFFCNWNVIKSCFEEGTMATIVSSSKAVGFACWSVTSKYTATIEIVSIEMSNRGKGLGEYLSNELFKFLKAKSILVLDLHCSPPTSGPFWRKLDFKAFPGEYNSFSDDHVFKILIPSLKVKTSLSHNDNNETLELCDQEPYSSKEPNTKWVWNPRYKSGRMELTQPIIHPAKRDWRIIWRNGESVLKDDKVKRFGNEEIDFGYFIIIKRMPSI